MKSLIIPVLAACLFAVTGCTTELTEAERRAISRNVSLTADSLMEAWANKEQEAFLNFHTRDFTFAIEGNLFNAQQAKKLLPGIFSRNDPYEIEFTWENSTASVLDDDLALYFGTFRITKTDSSGAQSEETGAMSIIFNRVEHVWRADHIHESIPNR